MTKKRYYVDTEGNDDNAYLEAIAQAGVLAVDDPTIKKVILLVHTKSNTAWFDRLFGPNFTKQLFSGAQITGVRPLVKLETLKTFSGSADIVIACALDDKDLFTLDDNPFIGTIIAIPWQKQLVSQWVSRWSPEDIRTGKKQVRPTELSCIVKKALESLTNSILNPSTGLAHPSDEHRAKTIILALHKYESPLDPKSIGSYLVAELNWSAKNAQDVQKLFETLDAGRFFRGGERTGLKNYYKQWKDACK